MSSILFYGDNLDILKRYMKDESVDLIYLDPPFKGDQNYNVLFKEQDGSRAASESWAIPFAAEIHGGKVRCRAI